MTAAATQGIRPIPGLRLSSAQLAGRSRERVGTRCHMFSEALSLARRLLPWLLLSGMQNASYSDVQKQKREDTHCRVLNLN